MPRCAISYRELSVFLLLVIVVLLGLIADLKHNIAIAVSLQCGEKLLAASENCVRTTHNVSIAHVQSASTGDAQTEGSFEALQPGARASTTAVRSTPARISPTTAKYAGVASTLFLGAPKWFQNRYSLMVNQMLAALPAGWIVQIFFLPNKKMAVEGTQHPGIQKQIAKGNVVLTEIPLWLVKLKLKRNQLFMHPWLWESMLADSVLLFGGNSVLCANSPFTVGDFLWRRWKGDGLDRLTSPSGPAAVGPHMMANHGVANMTRVDYIGAPWKDFKGVGGSGAISLRNRTAVLAAIKHFMFKESKRVAFSVERPVSSRSLLPKNSYDQMIIPGGGISISATESSLYAPGKSEGPQSIDTLTPTRNLIYEQPTHESAGTHDVGAVPSRFFDWVPPKVGKKEDVELVKALLAIDGRGDGLANPEETRRFAMSEIAAEGTPFGAVGTLAPYDHLTRQRLLDYCPEMKMMFPSLHNPSCFGSDPDAIGCILSLCEHGGIRCERQHGVARSIQDKKGREITVEIRVKEK